MSDRFVEPAYEDRSLGDVVPAVAQALGGQRVGDAAGARLAVGGAGLVEPGLKDLQEPQRPRPVARLVRDVEAADGVVRALRDASDDLVVAVGGRRSALIGNGDVVRLPDGLRKAVATLRHALG